LDALQFIIGTVFAMNMSAAVVTTDRKPPVKRHTQLALMSRVSGRTNAAVVVRQIDTGRSIETRTRLTLIDIILTQFTGVAR